MGGLNGTPATGRRPPPRSRWLARRAAQPVAVLLVLGSSMLGAAPAASAAAGPRTLEAYRITATIGAGIGSNPTGMAITPDGRELFVTNLASRSVSVISTASNTVRKTITVGRDPTGVAVSPDGRRAYVVYGLSDGAVAEISTATGTVTRTIRLSLDSYPQEVAVSPDSRTLYVTNWNPSTVSVVSAVTSAVTATIKVGTHPVGVAVLPGGGLAYVANQGAGAGPGTMSVIDTAGRPHVTKTIALGTGNGPWEVEPSPGNRAYVTNSGGHTVSVIDTATNRVTGSITVGLAPYGVAVNPATARAYVTNSASQDLSVISTTGDRVIAAVRGLHYPTGVAVSPDGARIYVANQTNPGTVSVISRS